MVAAHIHFVITLQRVHTHTRKACTHTHTHIYTHTFTHAGIDTRVPKHTHTHTHTHVSRASFRLQCWENDYPVRSTSMHRANYMITCLHLPMQVAMLGGHVKSKAEDQSVVGPVGPTAPPPTGGPAKVCVRVCVCVCVCVCVSGCSYCTATYGRSC